MIVVWDRARGEVVGDVQESEHTAGGSAWLVIIPETVFSRGVFLGTKHIAELLAVVQASLRRKVASLDEDNWMFESEEETPG